MPIQFHESFWEPLKNPVYFETGLFKGQSFLKAIRSNHFDKYYSLEVSETHITNFKKKIADIELPPFEVLHGNSTNLAKYIAKIDQPITFFLDAHDDQRSTDSLKELHEDPMIKCPIFEELQAIANHPLAKSHTILIDDMGCFDPNFTHETHNWFIGISKKKIEEFVKEKFPNHALYYIDSYRKKDILAIVPEQTSIPKIIHQTYKNKMLNKTFKMCKSTVKQYYADFDYRFYTDDDMESFMNENYPKFKKKVFDRLPLVIMKVDVFRYLLLEKFGGLYLDLDQEIIRRFQFTSKTTDPLFLPKSRDKLLGDNKNLIGNSILASAPNHPFWGFVRKELELNIDGTIKIYKSQSKHHKKLKTNFVLQSTGPRFLTDVFEKYRRSLKNYELLHKHTFHHKKPLNEKMMEKYRNNTSIFGHHHCTGTWQ